MRGVVFIISLFVSFCVGAQEVRLVLPAGHTKAISFLEITKDNKRLLSGSEDGTIRLWDMNSGKELLVFEGHFGTIRKMKFYSNDERIISIADDQTLKIWDATNGIVLQSLKEDEKIIF